MKTNIAESFNKDLYDKILSSFSENEKKLDSEWKIQKIYDGINYDLEKKVEKIILVWKEIMMEIIYF